MSKSKIKAKMSVNEIVLKPPVAKGDGTRRTRPSATVKLVHNGTDEQAIATFFASQDAVLACTITPIGEAEGIPPWSGVCRVKECKIKPPNAGPRSEEQGEDVNPIYHIVIVVEHEHTRTIAELVEMRLGMIDSGDSAEADVQMSPFQGKLPFGEPPPKETAADEAADSWDAALSRNGDAGGPEPDEKPVSAGRGPRKASTKKSGGAKKPRRKKGGLVIVD